ncbi:MAG TPA: DUF5104 domain-containing protein [Galbitalea sp.]|jgi:hypothetical protein|nr:DUF5104 domain-containing protein [Galbitalea sp.]
MQRIADAAKDHDAAALKKLFSTTAREKATGLDDGLKYFLSVFPSGFKSWTGPEDGGPGETDENEGGNQIRELRPFYKVSANGRTYELYFADYTANQVGPDNLGLSAFEDHKATGTSDVYVPQK